MKNKKNNTCILRLEYNEWLPSVTNKRFMSADLKCAVDYKLFPPCPTIDHHLYRFLYSLSALNRDSRYPVILSQCIPAVWLQAAPLLGFKHTEMRAHTHYCTITGGTGCLAWCPENWSLYCVSANLSSTSCFGGRHVHFISFSQTISVLWKGQYKPQSLKSLLKNAFVPLLFLKDQE